MKNIKIKVSNRRIYQCDKLVHSFCFNIRLSFATLFALWYNFVLAAYNSFVPQQKLTDKTQLKYFSSSVYPCVSINISYLHCSLSIFLESCPVMSSALQYKGLALHLYLFHPFEIK